MAPRSRIGCGPSPHRRRWAALRGDRRPSWATGQLAVYACADREQPLERWEDRKPRMRRSRSAGGGSARRSRGRPAGGPRRDTCAGILLGKGGFAGPRMARPMDPGRRRIHAPLRTSGGAWGRTRGVSTAGGGARSTAFSVPGRGTAAPGIRGRRHGHPRRSRHPRGSGATPGASQVAGLASPSEGFKEQVPRPEQCLQVPPGSG